MKGRSLTGGSQFWLASLLIIAIIILSIGNYSRWWDIHSYVGPLHVHHWLSFIGAGYIAVFTPIYALAKRHSPQRFGTLLKIHVFGNLVAFLLISMHFTQHMGRPPQFAPTPGTGLTLYIIVALMVITGYMQRFRLAGRFSRTWRFVHVSLSVSFYIVLIVHVLHNLGLL
ncbi:MAG: hypothetical protein IBX67_04760 [Dehalococcoidia bacterium]|nr:hypothetical protein [Dehalococcoidia bacterium]